MQEEITRNMLKHKEVKEPMLILRAKLLDMYFINDRAMATMLEYTQSENNEFLNELTNFENAIDSLFTMLDKYNVRAEEVEENKKQVALLDLKAINKILLDIFMKVPYADTTLSEQLQRSNVAE